MPSCHAGFDFAGQHVEAGGCNAASLSHAFETFWSVQLDIACIAQGRSGGFDEIHQGRSSFRSGHIQLRERCRALLCAIYRVWTNPNALTSRKTRRKFQVLRINRISFIQHKARYNWEMRSLRRLPP